MSNPAGLFIPPRPLTAADGTLLPSGQLFFFMAGTDTPLPVYQDAELTTPYAQPVVADAIGLWGPIFLSPLAYKVELQDQNDVIIPGWPIDNVCSPGLPTPPSPDDSPTLETLFAITADAATSGAAETTLALESIPAGQLAADGESLEARFAGTFDLTAPFAGTENVIYRVSFGGTEIAEVPFLVPTGVGSFDLDLLIVRVSQTIVRCVVKASLTQNVIAVPPDRQENATPFYAEVTSLDLDDAQVLQLTGEVIDAGDVTTLKMGTGRWVAGPA